MRWLLNLREIVEQAGDMNSPPETPKIPKQYLPMFIRKFIWIVFLPFVWLDVFAKKFARWIVRPPFKKAGACKKRGNCCYFITMRKRKGPLGWIQMFWAQEINGFYKRFQKPFYENGQKLYVLGCRYLKKNGQCAHYAFRPTICREWPVIEYFGYPKLLKGCGYYPKALKKDLNSIAEAYSPQESSSSRLPVLDERSHPQP